MSVNKQKFNHYLAIVIDVVYIAGFLSLIIFTVNSAIQAL